MPNPLVFKSKLPKTGTSIFAIMSTMARKYNAINLSQGFPDFDVDERLKKLVRQALNEGHNQYAPMPGIEPLREVIAHKVKSLYDNDVDANEMITITSGGTEVLYAAISAVVHEGDEVIVFEPAYDSYVPAFGVSFVYNQLGNRESPYHGKYPAHHHQYSSQPDRKCDEIIGYGGASKHDTRH